MAKRRKYRNQPVTVDGHEFDSKAEARRFGELKHLLHAGKIRCLRIHTPFTLTVNNIKICCYEADFVYEEWIDGKWSLVIEDVKGHRTREYKLKSKLMLAIHGISIREIDA
jgi:hypothetical protein